ncbi:response regulator transcription factor [Dietzia sp.]|uniref:response regulator transcription factor n=1 Tax=Dietzia sp. TaxID=1871616 RepID=UPI002FDA8AEA
MSGDTSRITVGLADDQSLVRAGFAMVLDSQDDIAVLWQAANGREAVESARREPVDVVLMDIQMPELNGIDATREIVASGTETKVVVLTTFDDDEYVLGAIAAGASGFLLKDTDPEDLLSAVRTVGESAAVISPRATASLLRRVRESLAYSGAREEAGADAGPKAEIEGDARDHDHAHGHSESSEPNDTRSRPRLPELPEPLTEREIEILELIAVGRSNTEIAADLYLSLSTVKTHVGRVLAKTGSRDRVHAVLWAFRHGLVGSGDLLG